MRNNHQIVTCELKCECVRKRWSIKRMKERVNHKIERFFWNRKKYDFMHIKSTCAMNPRFATNCIQMLHKFANSVWNAVAVAREKWISVEPVQCDSDRAHRTIDHPKISPEIVTPNRKWLWQRRSLLSVRFAFTFSHTHILCGFCPLQFSLRVYSSQSLV